MYINYTKIACNSVAMCMHACVCICLANVEYFNDISLDFFCFHIVYLFPFYISRFFFLPSFGSPFTVWHLYAFNQRTVTKYILFRSIFFTSVSFYKCVSLVVFFSLSLSSHSFPFSSQSCGAPVLMFIVSLFGFGHFQLAMGFHVFDKTEQYTKINSRYDVAAMINWKAISVVRLWEKKCIPLNEWIKWMGRQMKWQVLQYNRNVRAEPTLL